VSAELVEATNKVCTIEQIEIERQGRSMADLAPMPIASAGKKVNPVAVLS